MKTRILAHLRRLCLSGRTFVFFAFFAVKLSSADIELHYARLGSPTNCILGLNFDSVPGVTYCVEQSPDLRHWTDFDCGSTYDYDTVWLIVPHEPTPPASSASV
jgi:hypothetical protein